MQIEVHGREVQVTDELQLDVERKLHYALRRFGRRVRHVFVQFRDLNGPKGGVDIQCRIQATLSPWGRLVVDAVKETPVAAISMAAHRAEALTERFVGRSRRSRRLRKE